MPAIHTFLLQFARKSLSLSLSYVCDSVVGWVNEVSWVGRWWVDGWLAVRLHAKHQSKIIARETDRSAWQLDDTKLPCRAVRGALAETAIAEWNYHIWASGQGDEWPGMVLARVGCASAGSLSVRCEN